MKTTNMVKVAAYFAAAVFVGAVAAIASGTAHAEAMAESRNEAGGKIVLTNERGSCAAGQQLMYAYAGGGALQTGCWMPMDGRILVRYSTGDVRLYDPTGFTLTEAGQRFVNGDKAKGSM